MEGQAQGAGAPRRAISPVQAARFVLTLRGGATVEESAAAAGLVATTLYYRRRVDPDFASLWEEAVAGAEADTAAARAREGAAKDAAQGTVVREQPGRYLIRRRRCIVEFTRRRRQVFLDHMAGSCNMAASARAAGVTVQTAQKALADDPAFAEAFDTALMVGYKTLEADALCQQQEAQAAYRLSPADDPEAAARTFDRTMQLLREYRRKDGSIGRRPYGDRSSGRGIRPRVASPEEVRTELGKALVAFEKRCRAQGYKVPDDPGQRPPPDHPG